MNFEEEFLSTNEYRSYLSNLPRDIINEIIYNVNPNELDQFCKSYLGFCQNDSFLKEYLKVHNFTDRLFLNLQKANSNKSLILMDYLIRNNDISTLEMFDKMALFVLAGLMGNIDIIKYLMDNIEYENSLGAILRGIIQSQSLSDKDVIRLIMILLSEYFDEFETIHDKLIDIYHSAKIFRPNLRFIYYLTGDYGYDRLLIEMMQDLNNMHPVDENLISMLLSLLNKIISMGLITKKDFHKFYEFSIMTGLFPLDRYSFYQGNNFY